MAGKLIVGIILAACGGAALALAMVTQRYALAYPSSRVPLCGCELPRNAVWFVGLVMYGGANGLYAVAQVFGPLSLLGGVFTTLLIFNMLFARLFLKEDLTKPLIAGAIVILVGVVLTIVATPDNAKTEFTPEDIGQLSRNPGGALYLSTLLLLVVLSVMAIAWYEAKYPITTASKLQPSTKEEDADTSSDETLVIELSSHASDNNNNAGNGNSNPTVCEPSSIPSPPTSPTTTSNPISPPTWLDNTMSILYPASLGIDEAVAHLCMKAAVSMLASCNQHKQCSSPILLLFLLLWVLSSLATLWWLRRVFARFPTSQALPVEYATVSAAAACSGLLFFREGHVMSPLQLALVSCGVAVTLLGIAAGRCHSEQLETWSHWCAPTRLRAVTAGQNQVSCSLAATLSAVRKGSRDLEGQSRDLGPGLCSSSSVAVLATVSVVPPQAEEAPTVTPTWFDQWELVGADVEHKPEA